MSSESKKKQLHTQLEDLFAELDQDREIQAFTRQAQTHGWVWECDSNGNYVACSGEVQAILGFTPEDFMGRSLAEFAVSPKSQVAIRKALQTESFPVETEVILETSKSKPVNVRLHVFGHGENGNQGGWRGFAEFLGELEEPQPARGARGRGAPKISLPEPIAVGDGGMITPDVAPLSKFGNAGDSENALVQSSSGEKFSVLATTFNLPRDVRGLLEIVDDDPNRKWTPDEQLLVAQVADQLSLALENATLFQQTQEALGETDTLYQASAELNAAKTYADVADVLKKYSLLGRNPALVAINLFNTPWTETSEPEWVEVLYRSTELPPETFRSRYKFAEFPALKTLLRRDAPAAVENTLTDARLDPSTRALLVADFQVSSFVFLPIVAGGQWLGFIDGHFAYPARFPEDALRQLSALSIQAAEKALSIQLNSRVDLRRQNADQLNRIARNMAEVLNERELRDMAVSLIYDYLQPDQINLFSWDEAAQAFEVSMRRLGNPRRAEDEYTTGFRVRPQERPDLQRVFEGNAPSYTAEDWAGNLLREHYCVPWLVADKSEGVIEVYHTARAAAISDVDQEFVLGVVLQAAAAIERARLFEQTQAALKETDEQARRLGILNQMSAAISQANELDAIFKAAIQHTHQIFPSDRVSITLLTPDREHVEVKAVLGERGQLEVGSLLDLRGTANQVAMEERRVVINEDTHESGLNAIRSFLVGPINVAGDVIGTLNIGSVQPGTFDEGDETFLRQLLATLAAAIENRRLFKAIEDALSDTEEQSRRLALLNELGDQINQANSVEEIANVAVSKAQQIFRVEQVSLAMLAADGQSFDVLAGEGPAGSPASGASVRIEGALAKVMSDGQIAINNQVEDGERTGIHASMVAPLAAAGKVIGTLNLGSTRANAFALRDQNLMLQLSSLLSGVIENNRLFGQIVRRSTQLQTSAEVSRVATSILEPEDLFQRVVNLIRDGFDLYYAGLFLLDETKRWATLQAGTGEAGRQLVANSHRLEVGGDSMIGKAAATGEARIALDVGAEQAFFPNPLLPQTRSEMALPLISRGEVLGALTIQSERQAAFTQEDITALQTLADQIANAVENARLFNQTERRAAELAVLNEMARTFTEILDENTVIEKTYEYCSRLMEARNFYLALYDAESEEIEFKHYVIDGQRTKLEQPRRTAGKGLTEWMIEHREPLLIEQNVDQRLEEMGIQSIGRIAQSWLGVPMLRGGQVAGVISVQSYDQPRQFNAHHMELLGAISNQTAVALENARLFYETQARARREQLLREITARVHGSADADTILRTAVREVSNALGRQVFIQLGKQDEEARTQPVTRPPAAPSNPQPEADGQEKND